MQMAEIIWQYQCVMAEDFPHGASKIVRHVEMLNGRSQHEAVWWDDHVLINPHIIRRR
jgi:hypothetical protein